MSSPAALFAGSTVRVARRLIGALLWHEGEVRVGGRIVETEAYLEGDPASHSFRGPTPRNGSMFLTPGHAYVYRIYGMHLCFNVSSARAGVGEAVLVRALEPLEGRELMAARRGTQDPRRLCDGPGKLCQALDIGMQHDGVDLGVGALHIEPARRPRGARVEVSTRIGLSRGEDEPLRFLLGGSSWVSRRA